MSLMLATDNEEFYDTEDILWLEAMFSQIGHRNEILTSLIFGDIFGV